MQTEATEEEQDPAEGANDAVVDYALSLSGGGSRASFFSLGVLWCLVDLGLNKRVTQLLSVSGGTLTNAAVGTHENYASMDSASFEGMSAGFVTRLSRQGIFYYSALLWWYIAKAAGALAIVITLGVVGWVAIGHFAVNPRDIPVDRALLVSLTFILACATGGYSWALRGSVQIKTITKFIGKGSCSLSEGMKRGPTKHIFVSTELLSGQAAYFSEEFIYSPVYGWGSSADIRLGEAIYASTAYPGAFPALAVDGSSLDFSKGARSAPRHLRLVDGGVCNNLGTDWFEMMSKEQSRLWHSFPFDGIYRPPSQIIVVNAGQTIRPIERLHPIVGSLMRVLSVVYANTINPRLSSMSSSMQIGDVTAWLVDIDQSPLEIAQNIAQRLSTDERGGRARLVVDLLNLEPARFWQEMRDNSTSSKTHLQPMHTGTSIRIVHHGYLSALVLMHCLTGNGDVRLAPDASTLRRRLGLKEERAPTMLA